MNSKISNSSLLSKLSIGLKEIARNYYRTVFYDKKISGKFLIISFSLVCLHQQTTSKKSIYRAHLRFKGGRHSTTSSPLFASLCRICGTPFLILLKNMIYMSFTFYPLREYAIKVLCENQSYSYYSE